MQKSNVNLPIQVTGRHVNVTDAMKDYASKKVQGLHLDYPRIIEAQVILDVQKIRHLASIVLFCANHITIEASASSQDMYASVDEALGRIARQMRKYKTRIMRNQRPRKGEMAVREFEEHHLDVEGFEEHEEKQPTIVQTEKYRVKPMYLDEAVLQLEVTERDFIIFQNVESEKINVLYRRKDGGLGLIEPNKI